MSEKREYPIDEMIEVLSLDKGVVALQSSPEFCHAVKEKLIRLKALEDLWETMQTYGYWEDTEHNDRCRDVEILDEKGEG